MDEYKKIKDYNPANTKSTSVEIQSEMAPSLIGATGLGMQDEIVPVIVDAPDVTGVSEMVPEAEGVPPDYLMPKVVVVNKYWLKK